MNRKGGIEMGRGRTNSIMDAGKINKETYKFPRKAFGKTLHRYRVKRGLTQEQLADLTQLSVSTISRFECGRIIPDLPTLVVLAANLEVDFNTLLGGTYDMHDTKSMNVRDQYYQELGEALATQARLYLMPNPEPAITSSVFSSRKTKDPKKA